VLLNGGPGAAASSEVDTREVEQDDHWWELRCRIAERRGDLVPALVFLDRARALRANVKEYESRRGRLLQRLGRADEARDAYTRTHELAQAALELWDVSRDLGVRTPTAEECERVAQLYERLERAPHAAAWRLLGRQLEPEKVAGEILPSP
jgi:tetratricopeptide (TPR) repeat protein